jgi:spermidine synthase
MEIRIGRDGGLDSQGAAVAPDRPPRDAMNDASKFPVEDILDVEPLIDAEPDPVSRLGLYFAVGLGAGAVIALQIDVMRVFSVGSWAHFGSLVVSLAMLGFGLASAAMTVAKDWFARHWRVAAAVSLALFGPLAVAANLYVQHLGFNAIFLVSDPAQKWKLLQIFLAELTPFLAGAFFLGCVFLRSNRTFGRVYFADLAGAGLCGLVVLLAMYVFTPANLIAAPLALWFAACLAWAFGPGGRATFIPFVVVGAIAFAGHFVAPQMFGLKTLAVNDYKGVAYARKFPDAKKVYESASPFGFLEIYSSSYLHFAPGLSDNAGFTLPTMPANAYLGLYIDSDGPIGIMRDLTDKETAYFRFLPMVYPYVIKSAPKTFIVQFGGGISTEVALHSGAKDVTVAEGNRAVLEAFRSDVIRNFTGDILSKVRVIGYEGRHFLAQTSERFDVVDLSLADSVGLSNPGGFAIVEKFSYTKEAMETYMRALAPGGVLSVTLWNKEEPPKSVLKLYATMAAAAREVDPAHMANSFFVASSYLSTATVLYKNGGFTPDEIEKLRAHTRAMSFDEIYSPGFFYDSSQTDSTLAGYVEQIFAGAAGGPPAAEPSEGADANASAGQGADANAPAAAGQDADAPPSGKSDDGVLPATVMGRLAWHALIAGQWPEIADRYVFNTRALTNDAPYFAAYVKTADLPRVLDRLELLQDEWGYLLIWATLGVACLTATVLLVIPLIWGWRTIFSRSRGKLLTVIYFACLGAGYIMVEVGLIAHFVMALGNPTISASVLITGMLVFSGLGALTSERALPRMRTVMPVLFIAVAALLILYGLFLGRALDAIGAIPYAARLLCSFLLIAPPAFLMGFPMPVAMTTLGRLGKDHMFVWAWGVNGCFSVIGAAAAPVIATNFGLAAVIEIAGLAYLLAIPAFYGVIAADRTPHPEPAEARA